VIEDELSEWLESTTDLRHGKRGLVVDAADELRQLRKDLASARATIEEQAETIRHLYELLEQATGEAVR
jgi:predicted  nucleic acid-binding Zn-ribbon protein